MATQQELNFDLHLPATPDAELSPEVYREFMRVYTALRLLADQVGGGDMLAWQETQQDINISGFQQLQGSSLQVRNLNLDTVLVSFYLSGASNSSEISFQLPKPTKQTVFSATSHVMDNGVISRQPGRIVMLKDSNIVRIYKSLTNEGWRASGTKSVAGQFIYRSA